MLLLSDSRTTALAKRCPSERARRRRGVITEDLPSPMFSWRIVFVFGYEGLELDGERRERATRAWMGRIERLLEAEKTSQDGCWAVDQPVWPE